jgi:hypothetical protein
MNLQEQIYRIQGLMVTEGKEGAIKSMIEKHGLYHSIKLMGGFDNSMDEYLTIQDRINFIKDVVSKLCDENDDIEISSFNLNGSQIEYDETDDESQVIEFYSPEEITVERFKLLSDEDYDDEEYDDDENDHYIGSFRKTYEELHPSLINVIFYYMLEQI